MIPAHPEVKHKIVHGVVFAKILIIFELTLKQSLLNTNNYKCVQMKIFFRLFLLISGILFFSSAKAKDVHPYHVGSVEFSYNTKSQTFEITGKFFIDDMENALDKKYSKKVFFNNPKFKNDMQALLQKYFEEYLKLKVNNNQIRINFLGYEENSEAVDVYLETEKVVNPKKIETAVSVLYNLFDDQMNIIHIVVGGQRKSTKLLYPDRYQYQQF